ncbi:MAG: hypothetical protein AAGL96_19490 [Pseudomonadota bacterium]
MGQFNYTRSTLLGFNLGTRFWIILTVTSDCIGARGHRTQLGAETGIISLQNRLNQRVTQILPCAL